MGSGATVVCDASAAISEGCCGASGISDNAPFIAFLSGMNVSQTYAGSDYSNTSADVCQTPQRIRGIEESDQPGHARHQPFTLPDSSETNSCSDEIQDYDSMDFNHANHSPPLIMMSRPHPESVSLSRPLVLRY